jgi:hypothetical protein
MIKYICDEYGCALAQVVRIQRKAKTPIYLIRNKEHGDVIVSDTPISIKSLKTLEEFEEVSESYIKKYWQL